MKIKIFSPEQTTFFPLYPSTVDINSAQIPISRNEGYKNHQLFVVTDGNGILNIEDKIFNLENGDMFYIKKDIPHKYYGFDSSFSTTYISFFGDGFSGMEKYYMLKNYGVYKNKNSDNFKSYAEKLFKEIDTTDNLSKLCSLVFSAVVSFFSETQKEDIPLIEQVLNFLEKNYNRILTLDDILTLYPYSKTKLCRDFKKKYNITIFEMLTDIRLNYARFMIDENPKIKLNEVISSCGFNDLSYFCKLYKRKYGVSPKFKY